MRFTGLSTPRRALLLVVLIVLIALASALASILSYNSTDSSIRSAALDEIHTHTQIEASDLANIVVAKLESVGTNLQIIAGSPTIATGNLTRAASLFSSAQNSTAGFTDSYSWIDRAGRPVQSSNETRLLASQRAGFNASQESFFTMARLTGKTYFSSAVTSQLDSRQKFLVVSQPLYSVLRLGSVNVMIFNGIVTASIKLVSFGEYVQSQLSAGSASSLGLVDPTGVILYSANESLIGVDVFGASVQSLLPPSLKVPFDEMLFSSLSGKSGFQDLSLGGNSSTLAYQPVFLPAGSNHEFAALYIAEPDALAATQASQIDLQRNVSMLSVLGISATAVVASVVVVRWNRKLDRTVEERTSDLTVANERLSAANKQLEEQSQAQRDFINVAAHELRTPTQSILVSSELLKDAMEAGGGSTGRPEGPPPPKMSDEEIRRLLSANYRNVNRLAKLTQNILDVARIDNRGQRLDLEDFDLNEVIGEAVKDSGEAGENGANPGVRAVFRRGTESLAVRADRTKVYEVILNLLKNAQERSKADGPVTVTARSVGESAVVTVRDAGTGIDPEVLPNLFSKFVTRSGTGLGLYISKNYVEAHGGRIWAENNADGPGATFSFSIPVDGPRK